MTPRRRFFLMVASSLLFCASESAGKFAPMTLAQLAGADVIAVGTIIRLSADSYTLRVTQWVAGERPRQELHIRRFVDWQDASREKPYEMDQRLMVFLKKGSGGAYRALGGACEGEVFLEDGKAHLRFPLVADSMTEVDLVEAITELRETRLKRDDSDYAANARRLLESRRRLVRAATLEMLIRDAAKWHGPGVEAPFGELLLYAVVHAERDVRVTAASWLGMRLGVRGAGQPVLRRLEELAASGPPEARPAAALAATFIEPDDARRHAVLLRTLSDAELPLDDRRAVAAEMIHIAKPRGSVRLGVPILGRGGREAARPTMTELRKPALEALAAIQDEEVAIGVLAYLAAMFDIPDPVPANIDPLKRAWVQLFAAATERD
jgi:hypothetical protein